MIYRNINQKEFWSDITIVYIYFWLFHFHISYSLRAHVKSSYFYTFYLKYFIYIIYFQINMIDDLFMNNNNNNFFIYVEKTTRQICQMYMIYFPSFITSDQYFYFCRRFDWIKRKTYLINRNIYFIIYLSK